MLSVEGRYSGAQYDDDRNTLLLTHYYLTDFVCGPSISGWIHPLWWQRKTSSTSVIR